MDQPCGVGTVILQTAQNKQRDPSAPDLAAADVHRLKLLHTAVTTGEGDLGHLAVHVVLRLH